ncbi:thermonuclease family protein [Asticcacaulis sp. BYS171W]|uniref:Thermonuclease family protein n=1 Tax=Asticcacaulis aquaticus TaxID=2984212 RepID=A0ABT5HSB7_9CAUL|nr:thermonuclease family protein [Asticcacaulis aquaticus]MDC7682838.1 thermonuclease family protein [Asticcacaulis aquaticus]
MDAGCQRFRALGQAGCGTGRDGRSPLSRRLTLIGLALAGIAAVAWLAVYRDPPKSDPAPPVAAITGEAEAIDGDSLRVSGIEIRLEGADAFEYDQRCGAFACGTAASANLHRLIDGNTVRCQPEGEDRYGRTLARCFVGDTDIAAAQVRAGLAVAYRRYSDRYVREEEAAKAVKCGAWAYSFQAPEDYRHSKT